MSARTRDARGTPLAISAWIVMLVAIAPPVAAESSTCTERPARLATVDAPHITDPTGDGELPWKLIHREATDLIAAWISGPSAWQDRDSGEPFRASIQVQDIGAHPMDAYYRLIYKGAASDVFLTAFAKRDGTWAYSYVGFEEEGWIVESIPGRVDPASGTITMEIPSVHLHPRPADGGEVRLELREVRAGYYANAQEAGVQLLADSASGGCAVILYES